MADHKPPRLDAGERETLVGLLQYQRGSVVRKVAGVGEVDASSSPLASGTTVRWVVAHLAQAESTWVEARFAGGEPRAVPDGSLADAVAAYRSTWERVDAIVAAASLDDLCVADVAEPPVNLRWV
ncbi:MAG TPA: DUF664 domain-containing protein, partial [Acidimicrobiales bacterium]|nr:DUF664 domain-containing protein [Acidimicrobiales bacterium]